MMMNVYVNNKDELNQKVQQYSVNGYKIDSVTNNNIIMKKKDYNMALFIILLLFVFFIGGIIYYLLAEEYVVNIEINPSKSGQAQPMMGDPNMVVMENMQKNSNPTPAPNTNTPSNSKATGFCTECGSTLIKTDKFCPNCGKKI